MSKAIKTLAIAAVIVASSSVAFAQSPAPYGGGYEPYYPNPPASRVGPYGYATPSYSDYYGTYPAHSWDPDPGLRAQLRSDFNRAVDGAPR